METIIANIVADFNDGTKTLFDLPYSPMLVKIKMERHYMIEKRLKYLTKMKVCAKNTNYEFAIKKIICKHKNDSNYKKLNNSLNTIFKNRFITGKKFYSNIVFLGYIDTGKQRKMLYKNYVPNTRLVIDEKGKLDLFNRIIYNEKNSYKCICNTGDLRYLNLFEVLGTIYILGTSCAVEFPLLLQKEMEKQGIILDCIETLKNDMIGTYNEVNFEDDKAILLGLQQQIDEKNEEIRDYYAERNKELLDMKNKVKSGKININDINYNSDDRKYIKQIQEDTTFEREKYCIDNKKYIDYRTLSARGQQYLDKTKGTVRLSKSEYRLKMLQKEYDCIACNDTGTAYWSDGIYGWCMQCSKGDEKYLLNLKKEQEQMFEIVMIELEMEMEGIKQSLDKDAELLLFSSKEWIEKQKKKQKKKEEEEKMRHKSKIDQDLKFQRERATIYGEKIKKTSSTKKGLIGTPITMFFKKVKI